ncbi:MAG: YbhB/YbcL family Raf kinase inhibitor-like protein, partial [Candidatus Nanopelagicales bacterium]|nr:YbhB/YbcL family Raf kinase inhibitor-like protein [Candidatus Nanopelagicales bacterium]
GYGGAAPPPGDHDHRYFFAVHALDVDHLDLAPETPAAIVGFNLTAHTIARAVLVATFKH